MITSKTNILFTCVGRRNYLVNYFRVALADNGTLIGTDASKFAPALVACDKSYEVPKVSDPAYISRILEICKKENIKLVVSLNDLDLPILAENAQKFKDINVVLSVSDKSIIDICFDKIKTGNFLKSIGLNTPTSYLSPDDALEAVINGTANFPMIVKPRWGSGSIGLEFVDNPSQLKLAFDFLKEKLFSTILGRVSQNDIENCIVIQSAVKGCEYGMDVVNDFNGNNIGVFLKKKMKMRSGETDMAQSCRNNFLEEIGRKIASSLRHKGMLDCDLFLDGGNAYVIDMNPRFGGGYPFTHCAGVDVPRAYIYWTNGDVAPSDCFTFNIGKIFSKCDRLVEIKP